MKILFKLIVLFLLMIPALFLSILIYIFGGWTRGYFDMPNPLLALIEWAGKL